LRLKWVKILIDSNLSHFQIAKENMIKLLNQNYKVKIFYLEKCFLYTKKRESVANRTVLENISYDRFKKLYQSMRIQND